jgi:hypothetical protein
MSHRCPTCKHETFSARPEVCSRCGDVMVRVVPIWLLRAQEDAKKRGRVAVWATGDMAPVL